MMNNYPRKILDGLTPLQSFTREFRNNPLISSALVGILYAICGIYADGTCPIGQLSWQGGSHEKQRI
jgi:hypothetical protein